MFHVSKYNFHSQIKPQDNDVCLESLEIFIHQSEDKNIHGKHKKTSRILHNQIYDVIMLLLTASKLYDDVCCVLVFMSLHFILSFPFFIVTQIHFVILNQKQKFTMKNDL